MERLLRQNEEELLFKGKSIHCRNEPLSKGCGNLLVYRGYFKKANDPKEEIVVRKIKKTDCDDQWEDICNKHTREEDAIKHDNVLKIISYEEMEEWRYFALERYDATLEQFCKGIYKGPMPSDAQVLCQITKGLLYLHKEQCTHGNLTPRTILIASSQPVRIKLSEFGLSKFGYDDSLAESHDQDGNSFHRAEKRLKYTKEEDQNICHRKYWRLDGATENNQTHTPNQDIFSAGCLCFYFIERGVHPYGDDTSSILENIKKRNPINLKSIQQEKGIWEFAYDPIKHMIGNPPTDGTNWLGIAEASFMKALPLRFEEKTENKLGQGGYGTVFRGTFEGNDVAVKIFKESLDDARKQEQKREMEEHFRLNHVNVLKVLHFDRSPLKTCLVLELCAGTLTNYCEMKYNGPELPPDGIVLYQIANGLHYIHSRNLVHRDVKPDNILISITTPVQMKLSDFGFVKKISPQGTYTQSGLKGTEKWMASEILELLDDNIIELPRGTIQSDTFAAGCVFFYFLTRGKHPFGKSIKILANILDNNPIELNQHKKDLQGDDRALYELIGKMIKKIDERISLSDVIKHLTAKLNASRQFKKFEQSMSGIGRYVNRFHPTEPVLACGGEDKLIFFFAENSSIPFSNWKEKETQLQPGNVKMSREIEWNVDGTQLAAVSDDVIVCWNYPSGESLFPEKILNEGMNRIEWNPFKSNVFAAFGAFGVTSKVVFFNSCPVDQRPFHFCSIDREKRITSVQWISENRVALGLSEKGGGIEIWEIDESTATAQIVKRFEHEDDTITDMEWDERTKCLAACSLGGWMTIWSMDDDQPIHATKVDGECLSCAWRPNGKPTDENFTLAGGLDNGRIVIWTPLAEKKTRLFNNKSRWIESPSFSPDGRFLASASADGEMIIWATENWQPVYIDEREKWKRPFSWLSSSSTDVPNYKLAFTSSFGEVRVIEYAVDQSENPSKN